ncbi:hypothetical protein JQ619_12950 [Bradyrhizobium denitrificans]|uniref:DUF5666 domain-containing protein n=2 Tax=Nitrobacteraceae TaxID=41294 RepID=A0ABS5G5X5_9BRAD|nr:hypothetical protein [Bradyrhizobium denitrificans]MDU6747023.1 hypothetical protein [Bradyrhizobium sp.]
MVATTSMLAIAQQAPVPTRVRGAVESVDAETMTVKARSGEIFKLRMAGDLRVSGVVKADLADIKPGSFIGATTVPGPDGAPKAVEIHIFPEEMRGTGEGSRSWDLKPNSSMTNATVSESSVSTDGHTLLVKYKGGEKRIDIAPETPIVTFVPGDKSELKAGAKVMATIKQLPDGSFETSRVSVGRDGITPPM